MMPHNLDDGRKTVSFGELAYSNMLIIQALVELLAEKGVLTQKEVMERVQRLKQEIPAREQSHLPLKH
jgi:hypothetical protein